MLGVSIRSFEHAVGLFGRLATFDRVLQHVSSPLNILVASSFHTTCACESEQLLGQQEGTLSSSYTPFTGDRQNRSWRKRVISRAAPSPAAHNEPSTSSHVVTQQLASELEQAALQANAVPELAKSLVQAARIGQVPADPALLLERLQELVNLQRLFPGFNASQQLESDVSILRINTKRVISSMRIFQDLAPEYLGPVGRLMPAASSSIIRNPFRAAQKLRLLEQLLLRYTGSTAPMSALLNTTSAGFLSLSEEVLQENMWALARLLGGKNAGHALRADLTLLELAPSVVQQALQQMQRSLGASDFSLAQRVLSHAPGLFKLQPADIRKRIRALANSLDGLGAPLSAASLQILRDQPTLLLQPPDALHIAVSALRGTLGLAPEQLLQLLQQRPDLLLLPKEDLLDLASTIKQSTAAGGTSTANAA